MADAFDAQIRSRSSWYTGEPSMNSTSPLYKVNNFFNSNLQKTKTTQNNFTQIVY